MTEICDGCGNLIKNHWEHKHVSEDKIYCKECIEKILFEDEEK